MNTDTRRYFLRPLTPIHIGTGDRLSPDSYAVDLQTKELVCLDLPRILAQLTPPQRTELERAIDGGRLRDTQNILKRTWSTAQPSARPALERFRVKLGPISFSHLKDIESFPERTGDISALPRNPFSGNVTLPGSSLKGALRTALLSFRASPPPDYTALPDLDKISDSTELEQTVLQYRTSTLENDPFRLLHVSDAEWPKSAVQIDMPDFRKLARGETKIQSHVERLLSRADESPERTEVHICIRPPERSSSREPLVWDQVIAACHKFYINRLNEEYKHFPFLQNAGALWMRDLQNDLNAGAVLIRLGRFCHFDSMSLDNLRRKPSRTGATGQQIGSTRTVCQIKPESPVPFGWALLEPK